MKWTVNHALPTGRNTYLYFSAFVIHIASFICGVIFTWSTPVSSKLLATDENPLELHLTLHDVSWLSSLVPLGAIAGTFGGGYLANSIGRKKTLITTLTITIIAFLMLAFAKNLYMYYVLRFVEGMCVGTLLTVVPMYIGEIAEVQNRGALGGLTVLFIMVGNLFSFSVGPYITIKLFTISCTILPIVFLLISIPFLPESPCFLILKDRLEEAKGSLMKLRRGDVEEELAELLETVKKSQEENAGVLDIFKTANLRKRLIITAGLNMFQQFTAFSPIIFNMHMIFEISGFTLPKEVSTIIIGVVQIVGTLVSSMTVDKVGRRPLLLSSATVTFISLVVLTTYFYLSITIDVTTITWLPMVALIAFMFFFNIGLGPVPTIVLGEVFPPHVKAAAASMTVAVFFVCCFATAEVFPSLVVSVDIWFAFMVFTVCNMLGIFFIWFRMPETKGRTLNEILESLE